MRRHAWNCDLSTKPGTDILTKRHMYIMYMCMYMYMYMTIYIYNRILNGIFLISLDLRMGYIIYVYTTNNLGFWGAAKHPKMGSHRAIGFPTENSEFWGSGGYSTCRSCSERETIAFPHRYLCLQGSMRIDHLMRFLLFLHHFESAWWWFTLTQSFSAQDFNEESDTPRKAYGRAPSSHHPHHPHSVKMS